MTFPETHHRVTRAAAKLATMERSHREFVEALIQSASNLRAIGTITELEGEVSARCLGLDLLVAHRPVAIDGTPKLVEYAFFAHLDDETHRHCVFAFYLHAAEQACYLDVHGTERISDADNPDLSLVVITYLADALLQSAAFSPIQLAHRGSVAAL